MFLPQTVSKKCYYWSTEVFSTLCSLITLSVFELLETRFSARVWWYHCLDSDARQHWKDKLIMPFSLFHNDLEILLFINGNCLLQQHSVTITVAQGTPLTLVCIVWVLRYCLVYYVFFCTYFTQLNLNVKDTSICLLSQSGIGIYLWNERGLFLLNKFCLKARISGMWIKWYASLDSARLTVPLCSWLSCDD